MSEQPTGADAGGADGTGTTADESRPVGGRHRRESPSRSRVGTQSRRSMATLVLALLCLPAAAAAIVFWQQTPASGSGTASSGSGAGDSSLLISPTNEAALAAAKSEIHTILSYNYRSIAQNVAAAEADSTGLFARQYARTARALLAEAKQVKAIVQATVGSAGVVSAAPSNVVVLLFVDQASVRQTAGQKKPTTRIDQSRVRATMTRVNGKWLVSDVAPL